MKLNIDGPKDADVDNSHTEQLTRHLLRVRNGEGYVRLMTLLHDHLRGYMQQYCRDMGRRFSSQLVLAAKGGNVFSALFCAFFDCLLSPQRTDALLTDHAALVHINDLDFEVFTDSSFRFAEIMDVAKLSAMALCDVRSSLVESPLLRKAEFSDGLSPQPRSDSVVVPVDKPPAGCTAGCNTLYMPVPSVLYSNEQAWYRPDGGRDATLFPISCNHTLKRLFGAEVVLLRMKMALGHGASAEVYDIAVPLHRDPIHRHMLADRRQTWFLKDSAGVQLASTHYMYYTLCYTLFEEGIAPWNTFKVDKKLQRLILCIVFCSVIDQSCPIPHVREACLTIAKDPVSRHNASLPQHFAQFRRDIWRAATQHGKPPRDFVNSMRTAFNSAAALLGDSNKVRLDRGDFLQELDMARTIRRCATLVA